MGCTGTNSGAAETTRRRDLFIFSRSACGFFTFLTCFSTQCHARSPCSRSLLGRPATARSGRPAKVFFRRLSRGRFHLLPSPLPLSSSSSSSCVSMVGALTAPLEAVHGARHPNSAFQEVLHARAWWCCPTTRPSFSAICCWFHAVSLARRRSWMRATWRCRGARPLFSSFILQSAVYNALRDLGGLNLRRQRHWRDPALALALSSSFALGAPQFEAPYVCTVISHTFKK